MSSSPAFARLPPGRSAERDADLIAVRVRPWRHQLSDHVDRAQAGPVRRSAGHDVASRTAS
jgi:hypothetical protein